MKILSRLYERMIQCPLVPPETGGIIGVKDEIVCDCFFDNSSLYIDRAIYVPDVDLLNIKIRQWGKDNISFGGMFHSHPVNQPELSSDDIEYMQVIFETMHISIKHLYFPVILPSVKILAYKATRFNGNFHVYEDKITII